MIVWLNTSQQLCQQLRDKLKVFDTLTPKLANYQQQQQQQPSTPGANTAIKT